MIVTIPLLRTDKEKHSLKFVDATKEEYNVLHVVEEKKGEKWELGTVEVLGLVNKLDVKRLARAS